MARKPRVIDERIRAEREIKLPGPRASFSELLCLTCDAFGVKQRDLVQAERQRGKAEIDVGLPGGGSRQGERQGNRQAIAS